MEGEAKFSVALFYKNSAHRQTHAIDDTLYNKDNKITADQIIDNDFSYTPEINANIVIAIDKEIVVNSQSGLSGFWQKGETLNIPAYAKVAYYPTLNFNDGSIAKLIQIDLEKKYQKGTLSVHVTPTASEGDKPVKVLCAQDVYDELSKIKQATPDSFQSAMRYAIVTQVLCAVYGEVGKIEDEQINNGLSAHLELLKKKPAKIGLVRISIPA
ncbi:MAG: hypothetical protein R1F54_04155 [Candidatus Zeuxoniibacter abyssi]|nr:MAG: hypothetical protein R1F54_04155 [Candidatus Persebacteraceae bacterium AB1(2)]